MNKRLRKIVTAAGAAVVGLVLVQPASAQRDPAITLNQAVSTFGASPAHTSCDALQGLSREDCLAYHSSPSVTEGAFTGAGRFDRDSASPHATARAPSDGVAGSADHGANPATTLCDALQGEARANCFTNSSAGGGVQQGFGD